MHPTRSYLRLSTILLVFAIFLFCSIHVFALYFGTRLAIMQDELNFLYEALRIPSEGRLTSYWHGPFLFEIIAVLEGLFYAVSHLMGNAGTPIEFLANLIHQESLHLVAFRALISLISLGLVVQVYRLGKIVGGKLTGALAALLCASNLTFHLLSTMVKEDALYWLLLFSASIKAWEACEEEKMRGWFVAGLLLGAATATKYLGVFSYLIFLLPILYSSEKNRLTQLKEAVFFASVTGVTFLVLVPFVVTDRSAFFASLHNLNTLYHQVKTTLLLPWYIHTHLPNLLGWVVLCLGAFEFFRRVLLRWRSPALLGLAFFPPVVVLGLRSGYHCSHYIFPAGIFLAVYAAAFAERFYNEGQSRLFRWAPVLAVIAISLGSSSFLRGSLKYLFVLTGKDTRMEALHFIQTEALPNDRILVTTAVAGFGLFGPPLNSTGELIGKGKFREAGRLARLKNTSPSYRVTNVSGPAVWSHSMSDEYDWIIVPTNYPVTILENSSSISRDQETTPQGFSLVATFLAVPEPRSNLFPCTVPEDYTMYRELSLKSAWNNGNFGHTIKVYRSQKKGSGI